MKGIDSEVCRWAQEEGKGHERKDEWKEILKTVRIEGGREGGVKKGD